MQRLHLTVTGVERIFRVSGREDVMGSRLACVGLALLLGVAPAAAQSTRSLVIGIAQEPSSLDPLFHNVTPNDAAARAFFETLFRMDEEERLVPGLATAWRTADPTTWEVELRRGVRFHDGSAFTAEDVVYTMARAPRVPNSPSSYAQYVAGMTFEVVAPDRLRIRTATPSPLLPNNLANLVILPRGLGTEVRTEDFNAGRAIIGTGPYRFVRWAPGQDLVMRRNPDYRGEAPRFETVTVKPLTGNTARVAALLSGSVDLIEQVPVADLPRLRATRGITLHQGVSNRTMYLFFDHFREPSPFLTGTDGRNPLRDLRVRQAVSMAIDRRALAERLMDGVAVPAAALLPASYFGVSPRLQVQAQDLDGARRLLAEAGYPNGFGLTLHAPSGRYLNDARMAQAVGQMLQRIGISMQVETMPSAVFFSQASSGGPNGEPRFSFIFLGINTGTGEASASMRPLVACIRPEIGFGASNRGRYCNPRLDALLEEALRTVEDARRRALLERAMELTVEDLAVVPLVHMVNTWAGRDRIGYRPRTDERTLVTDVTLTD
jgi:peptide/nickel transport system substrate-binding protein